MIGTAAALEAPPLLVDRREMPYRLDAGLGERCRIGLIVLATDQTLEHEFRRLLDQPGVAFYESRLHNAPTISVETLAAMEAGLTGATALLMPGHRLDVVAYACTSGAMVIGEAAVHARIRAARPEVACTTPMEASTAALHALGVRRVALVAPYVHAINVRMRRYLLGHGLEVPVMGSWNEPDDGRVACISPDSVAGAVRELGAHEAVDGVFVACTSVRVAERVETLERELGKPVTSSNHALAWHCLRLGGFDEPVAGRGALFRCPLP